MTEQPFGPRLVAGDTWVWTISLADFSPSQFTLKYAFRGPSKLDITATAAGTDFVINVPGTASGSNPQTSTLQAGFYAWSMSVFDASGNRTELGRGTVEIIADVFAEDADGAGIDPRSWVKISLDAVRAVLQGRASRVEAEYQINGRMLRLMTPKDLMDLEGQLTARYRRELLENGQLQPQSNQVQVSFGDPTNPILQRLWKNFPGNSA